MSKKIQRPNKSFFQEPKELGNLIKKENLIHKYLAIQKYRQNDRTHKRKVLKGTHLPVEIKEIQAGYLYSSYFKDLKICTYICHKINCLLPRWQLEE